jgi:hypothetical protein
MADGTCCHYCRRYSCICHRTDGADFYEVRYRHKWHDRFRSLEFRSLIDAQIKAHELRRDDTLSDVSVIRCSFVERPK